MVSISSDNFTIDMLSNPSQLTSVVIDAMQRTEAGDGVIITDPNNGFVMQLMANMAVFSKFSEKIDKVESFLYPQRARTSEQLFPHLSEFDYVKLMAQPASLNFVFAIAKRWIVDNAVPFDANYNKIQIPATSVFTMNGIPYSTYHPIDILVNKNTGAVTAFYNTDEKNSLSGIQTNMLLDDQELTRNGIEYFQIMYRTFQFGRDITTYTVGFEQGFSKVLNHPDQFYAVRVFSLQNDVWEEMIVSLDKIFYDPQTPTALLTLIPENGQVRVDIPKIYFNNDQIAKSIKIELYHTKGKVNYSLSMADVQGLEANFDTKSSPFAAPLAQIPIYEILPRTTEVAGGTDAMSYDEIYAAVVSGSLYNRVAVTTPEIIEAGKKAGFTLNRIVDDLTDRVYFASNILVDAKGTTVPVLAGDLYIADESLNGNPKTIINHSDEYYTILPTTTFMMSGSGVTARPMTDAEVEVMSSLSPANLVKELNTGKYLRQAFHITLLTSVKSPQAFVYNLLSPNADNLSFIGENSHSAPQLSAIKARVVHLQHGTGGYQIYLNMVRSANIDSWSPDMFSVMLRCQNKIGGDLFFRASFVSSTNGVETWVVNVPTSYHISTDNFITVRGENDLGVADDADISLNQKFTLFTSFSRAIAPTLPVENALNAYLPSRLATTHLVMMAQELTVQFGVNLSRQIYCGVNTSWGNDVYLTAENTIYHQTPVSVYQTDDRGILVNRIVDNTVDLVELYPAGSVVPFAGDLDKTISVSIATTPSSGVYLLDDTIGILVGMSVRGTGVPVNTKVTEVSSAGIKLSATITGGVKQGNVLTFTNPNAIMTISQAQSSAGKTLTVESSAGLLKGMRVSGFDIPSGAVISSIPSSTKITLSVATTAPLQVGTVLTIVNTTAPGVVKTRKGEVITDPTGKPILVKSAQNQYLIPTILFDGRMFASDDVTDIETVEGIAKMLTNYATQIKAIDDGLIEDSDVYYRPARTMGRASFGVTGDTTRILDLQLSFSVLVYVDVSIYNSQTLLSTMEKSILDIIGQSLTNDVISLGEIGEIIRNRLGKDVFAVEMGPISGIDGLRLVALQEQGCSPSIEQILVLETDGNLKRIPNVSIEFLPRPDTSQQSQLMSL